MERSNGKGPKASGILSSRSRGIVEFDRPEGEESDYTMGAGKKPAFGLAFIIVFEQMGRKFLISRFAPIRLGKCEKRIVV